MCTSSASVDVGRKRANGPMLQDSANHRAVDHAVGENLRVVTDLAVADHAVRSDAHAIAELHLAFEHDVHVDERRRPVSNAASNIEARGVDDSHARQHQLASQLTPQSRLELGELGLIVDAQHLDYIRGDERIDGNLLLGGHSNDVREVILSLGVVVAQSLQPLFQEPGRCGQHACIAFADLELFLRGVLLLDDLLHAAMLAPDDAAVSRRVVELHCQKPGLLRPGKRQQLRQSPAGDERHVAIENEHPVIVRDARASPA